MAELTGHTPSAAEANGGPDTHDAMHDGEADKNYFDSAGRVAVVLK